MTGFGLHDLTLALRLTLSQPRQAARMVIGWPFTTGERWSALALVAICSTVSAEVLVHLTPEIADPMTTAVLSSPLAFAILQFAGLAVMAGLIHAIGKLFRGTGHFEGALAVLVWMQVILFALQLAQIVAMLILPTLAALIALASIVLSVWVLPSLIAELHGFRSALMTFFGMLGSMIVIIMVLSVLLVLFFGFEA